MVKPANRLKLEILGLPEIEKSEDDKIRSEAFNILFQAKSKMRSDRKMKYQYPIPIKFSVAETLKRIAEFEGFICELTDYQCDLTQKTYKIVDISIP